MYVRMHFHVLRMRAPIGTNASQSCVPHQQNAPAGKRHPIRQRAQVFTASSIQHENKAKQSVPSWAKHAAPIIHDAIRPILDNAIR